MPSCVDEHVGCRASSSATGVGSRCGSRADAAKATASTTLTPSSRRVAAKPSVQLEASHTTGSSPPREAAATAARTRADIVAWPFAYPFDDHGVPQHSASIPSGTIAETPARSSSRANASVAPMPSEEAGPNMLPTHAGRNTALGSTPTAPTTRPKAFRDAPPPGSSSA